jgi:GT2 family glycosyltransferase
VNWRQYALTEQCLQSLAGIEHKAYDLYVVDNEYDAKQWKYICEKFPHVYWFNSSENLGFTGGNNLALKKLLDKDYDFVLLLNNDTLVTPDFLTQMLRAARENPEAGAVAAKIVYTADPAKIWAAGGSMNRVTGKIGNRGFGHVDKAQFDHSGTVDYIPGCCFLIRMPLLRQIGLMDESLFAYFEDFDWSMKIKMAGYTNWYCHKALIYHSVGASSREGGRKGTMNPVVWYLNTRNKVIMLRRYYKGIYLLTSSCTFFMFLCVLAIAFVLRGRAYKSLYLWRGLRDGLKHRSTQ